MPFPLLLLSVFHPCPVLSALFTDFLSIVSRTSLFSSRNSLDLSLPCPILSLIGEPGTAFLHDAHRCSEVKHITFKRDSLSVKDIELRL